MILINNIYKLFQSIFILILSFDRIECNFILVLVYWSRLITQYLLAKQNYQNSLYLMNVKKYY
jgi:hypothetical protein